MDRLTLTLRLAEAASVIAAFIGGYGLIAPATMLKLRALPLGETSRRTLAEVRANYGGRLLLGHAAALAALLEAPRIGACLAAGLGSAWLGAAAGRSLSILIDRTTSWRDLRAIAFEAVLGVVLWAPLWIYLKLLHGAGGLVGSGGG